MNSALLGIASLLLVAVQDGVSDQDSTNVIEPERTIKISRVDDENYCTMVFTDISVRSMLTEVTAQLGIELEGFEGVGRSALISADLRDRQLRQTLEYVLGSVGMRFTLRTNALTVIEGANSDLTPDQHLQLASAAFFRAQVRFPGHSLAPDARINQAKIEELRGNWSAALEHYQDVRGNHSLSERVPEAVYGVGRMHEQLTQWSEASLTYRELINISTDHDFRAPGLKGLSATLISLNEPDSAMNTLKVLDKNFPAETNAERRDRLFLRAGAQLGLEQHIDCLRILEKLQSSTLAESEVQAVHRLRARAFEGLKMTSEAGRAWLLYAQGATGQAYETAIERSVQLALEAGDELAVLFIGLKVEAPSLRTKLEPYIREANERMGLVTAGALEKLTTEERIVLAEEHLLAKRFEPAKLALVDLLGERNSLPNNLRFRLAIGWAEVLEQFAEFQDVVDFLSSERPYIEQISDRSQLDIRAAAILEKNGYAEDAIAAFEGNY